MDKPNAKGLRNHGRRITVAAKDAYIEGITAGMTVLAAAEATGHHAYSFQRIREREPDFQQRYLEALERGELTRNDIIRQELRRRGVDGVEEPVFYRGEVVGHIRRFSDVLLMALANAHLAEHRDVYLRRDQPGAKPAEVHGLDLTKLTDQELDQLRTLAAKARPALTAVT